MNIFISASLLLQPNSLTLYIHLLMATDLFEEGGVLSLLLQAGAHHDGLEACPVDCPQLAVRCRLDCCRPEHNINEEAQMAKQDVTSCSCRGWQARQRACRRPSLRASCRLCSPQPWADKSYHKTQDNYPKRKEINWEEN